MTSLISQHGRSPLLSPPSPPSLLKGRKVKGKKEADGYRHLLVIDRRRRRAPNGRRCHRVGHAWTERRTAPSGCRHCGRHHQSPISLFHPLETFTRPLRDMMPRTQVCGNCIDLLDIHFKLFHHFKSTNFTQFPPFFQLI